MRIVEKFGPFPFGEPLFGDWPSEPEDGVEEIDGPAMPPEPYRHLARYRGHARVRVRVRSRRSQDDVVSRWHGVARMNPAMPSRLAARAVGAVQTSSGRLSCGRTQAVTVRAEGNWNRSRGIVRGVRLSKAFVGAVHGVSRRLLPTVKSVRAEFIERKRAVADTQAAIAAVITAMRR